MRRPVQPTRRAVLALLCLLGPSAACRHPAASTERPRCAACGMRIAPDSHWQAGALAANGSPLAFDTAACLFRHRLSPQGAGLHGEWVTEYYGPAGRRTDARSVRYVQGSDLVGPMGPDLVPVEPARLETFRRDHHPRRDLGFDDVTPAVLADL
jgi:nitrous oxide reductase accessory protein NosL